MTEYHKRIKMFREMRNFSQEHMADVLKLSQRAYSAIENGQTQLTVERLFEISDTLNVPFNEIIGVENQKVYHNNFNNHATQNKGNLIFNQDNFEEQRSLYERLLAAKESEIILLKETLNTLSGRK